MFRLWATAPNRQLNFGPTYDLSIRPRFLLDDNALVTPEPEDLLHIGDHEA